MQHATYYLRLQLVNPLPGASTVPTKLGLEGWGRYPILMRSVCALLRQGYGEHSRPSFSLWSADWLFHFSVYEYANLLRAKGT